VISTATLVATQPSIERDEEQELPSTEEIAAEAAAQQAGAAVRAGEASLGNVAEIDN